MKTLKSITVGERIVVLRSDGTVYVGLAEKQNTYTFAKDAFPVARSAVGCDAMADALREMGNHLREQSERGEAVGDA